MFLKLVEIFWDRDTLLTLDVKFLKLVEMEKPLCDKKNKKNYIGKMI